MLKNSLKILLPNSIISFFRKSIFLIIEVIISWEMVTQINTMALTKNVLEIIITILVALIAVVFTGYAFFQALIDEKLLVTLLSVDNKKGNLSGTNEYFAEVMVLQMTCIVVDLFVLIFVTVFPQDWCVFKNVLCNEIISAVIIVIMLHINIEAIWEMKSFVFNVFQLFNLHAYARMKEIEKKQ